MHKKLLYQIKHLKFSYNLGNQHVHAIRDLTLDIPSSSLITISGPSGSGKSTLLNILGLIEPVQEGTILFNGENLAKASETRKNTIRRLEIGFIFQQYHLFPILNAEENVRYFLHNQNLSHREVQERTEESLVRVGLWTHRMKRPGELSGGQKQRVAIARALAKHPSVIIGDEPTGSLDQKTGHQIMEILTGIVESKETSVILTTHDPMVQTFAQHNFHIQDGRLSDVV